MTATPKTETWLEGVTEDSEFGLPNLPFGVFSHSDGGRLRASQCCRCCTRVGDRVVDLSVLEEARLFADIRGLKANSFCQSTLNKFLEHPKQVWLDVRKRLVALFVAPSAESSPDDDSRLRLDANLQQAALVPLQNVEMRLPLQVGDYTDFYSSREHATNVGTMFRGKDNALQPVRARALY